MRVNTGDGPVVQGTQLIMNCSVSVSSSVDTEFSVNISWTSQPERVLSGPSVTISDISSLGHQLHRTVTISPVDLTDSAVYTCTASVSPVIGTAGVMASDESEDAVNITVEGELALYQCLSQILRFYYWTHMHTHIHTHTSEPTLPSVVGGSITSLAGQPLSIDCNFTAPLNLVTPTTVEWLDSSGSVVSDSRTLSFSELRTSDGGPYICRVTIFIPHPLTGNDTTNITVQSEL